MRTTRSEKPTFYDYEERIPGEKRRSDEIKRLKAKANRMVWGHCGTAVLLFFLFLYALGEQWSAAWVIGLGMVVPLAFVVLEGEE